MDNTAHHILDRQGNTNPYGHFCLAALTWTSGLTAHLETVRLHTHLFPYNLLTSLIGVICCICDSKTWSCQKTRTYRISQVTLASFFHTSLPPRLLFSKSPASSCVMKGKTESGGRQGFLFFSASCHVKLIIRPVKCPEIGFSSDVSPVYACLHLLQICDDMCMIAVFSINL